MRIHDLSVRDVEPVRLFAVDDLADVVVVAGPNGVGKTRLLEHLVNHLRQGSPNPNVEGHIDATASAEREAWGKPVLDMASPGDMELFRSTLQRSRRRQKWQSSLINFESDRTIRNLQPLEPSWDMPDPDEEEVSWDLTSGYMHDRFQDTVHSMYRMLESQRQGYGQRAVELGRQGHTSMNLNFVDSMQPFRDIFSLLLGPKELVDPSVRHQQLEYREGDVYPFSSLSSGEREVVNIAFDFLLRAPQDCIVFLDEPELHLHPELSFRLMQSLRRIGSRNQFILSTHSPDVITSALDQSVIFVSPSRDEPTGSPANQAVMVAESDETNRALRLMGQSIGIVALGRRIVLVEGEHSSLDKQTYGSIVGSRWPGLVLVPSGGKHVIESFDKVYEAVLSRSIWGVEFFMLCDRDSQPVDATQQDAATASGRLRLLPRRHLENYFLDEEVWALAFARLEDSESWLRSPEQVRDRLRELATQLISYGAALSLSHELRQLAGNVDVMPSGSHGKSLPELQQLILDRASTEAARIVRALDPDDVREKAQARFDELESSIREDTAEWRSAIPGKQLFKLFAAETRLNVSRAKNLYLAAAEEFEPSPFEDVLSIFAAFAEL